MMDVVGRMKIARTITWSLSVGSVVLVLVAVACFLQSGDSAQFWMLLWITQFLVTAAYVTSSIEDAEIMNWLIEMLAKYMMLHAESEGRRCQCQDQYH